MLALADLLTDVDDSVLRRSGEDRARTLGRITDLLVRGADRFGPEQIELFDVVIQRFASAIEISARIELATRLAPLPNAPPGVIVSLARDEIVVARPVLSISPVLDDQVLMAIALDKGRDHMLAICDRRAVSPLVTDVLLTHGDMLVRQAVAGNSGAKFSPSGIASLIQHAGQDDLLNGILRGRSDLSPFEAGQLVAAATSLARDRLEATAGRNRAEIRGAVERGASSLARRLGLGRPSSALEATSDGSKAAETKVLELASEGRGREVIEAVAATTGLSRSCVERIFDERDNDLLIVVGKARGWSWRTVRKLLALRDPSLKERHQFRRAEEVFDGLSCDAASRVLQFLNVRESSAAFTSTASPTAVTTVRR